MFVFRILMDDFAVPQSKYDKELLMLHVIVERPGFNAPLL